MRSLALLILALPLAGCDLNPLMGKPSQAQIQAEARVEAGLPPVVNPWHEPAEVAVEVAVVEPTPAMTDEPEPAAPTPETCVEQWRVIRCVGGIETDWYS